MWWSLTGKGVTVLVRNSPKPITFQAVVENELCHHTGARTRVDPIKCGSLDWEKISKMKLFVVGSCKVIVEKN